MSPMPPRSTSISMRRRAGVEAVLGQLLHDGAGPLDHFARGDLIDELTGQNVGSACRGSISTAAHSMQASAASAGLGDAMARELRSGASARSACRAADWFRSTADAGEDRLGQLLLVLRRSSGAIPRAGFEMYAVSTSIEGMSGDFSTTKPACCTFGLRTSTDAIERQQHALGRRHAGADVRGLRKIEQHGGERAVLVVERHAAHEVRRVLALGEPARRFAAGAALGEHVHRCAG